MEKPTIKKYNTKRYTPFNVTFTKLPLVFWNNDYFHLPELANIFEVTMKELDEWLVGYIYEKMPNVSTREKYFVRVTDFEQVFRIINAKKPSPKPEPEVVAIIEEVARIIPALPVRKRKAESDEDESSEKQTKVSDVSEINLESINGQRVAALVASVPTLEQRFKDELLASRKVRERVILELLPIKEFRDMIIPELFTDKNFKEEAGKYYKQQHIAEQFEKADTPENQALVLKEAIRQSLNK